MNNLNSNPSAGSTGEGSDNYSITRRDFSFQLATISININHKMPILQEVNVRFEDHHEKAMHYRNSGDTDKDNHYTNLARRDKATIRQMYSGLDADILRRNVLAQQAQHRYPEYKFHKFAEIDIYHQTVMDISHTYLNAKNWAI